MQAQNFREAIKQTSLSQERARWMPTSVLKQTREPDHLGSESLHSFVLDWLDSVGSEKIKKRCLSVSHLDGKHGDPAARAIKSDPGMTSRRDPHGFTVPPTPASTGPRYSSEGSSHVSSTTRSNPRNPRYRRNNLELNHIYVKSALSALPDHLSSQIDRVRARRRSPELSNDELNRAMHQVDCLAAGCSEDQLAKFLHHAVFPDPDFDAIYGSRTGLAANSNTLMAQHLVPAVNSNYRVTQPKPDNLYGYSPKRGEAFTESQFLAQTMIHKSNPGYADATPRGLRFPFFAIEFKAGGGTCGDLWVAVNQCAADSSACLNALGQLNSALEACKSARRIDNLSYSIAVDNRLAELYISWKEDDLNYYLRQIDTFVLSRPEEFKNFRKQVRNILDWGKDRRLPQIRDALYIILEENKKSASAIAKSRPRSDSSRGSGKRRQTSSPREQ
ncbi:hypothetical protein XA68_12363 [Ophiocordyceps unilateralis]|uniref:DUF7924 domain-containing protein n=1 Tax=Ophiocordyceps unilateralis TaxID=268505 RepID=A0A2A9PQD6_OPHUN|nr:hypothetical protein XA68_12363 [Ophiocordyceps unilateralis]